MYDSASSMLPELRGVRERLYEKFDISLRDAELAVHYVCCFLDAKMKFAGELIILPQIADWAWHELILDTVSYRSLCMRKFGYVLPHIKESDSEHLREVFALSMAMFRANYGLESGDKPEEWLDAGWDHPSYRLRRPVSRDLTWNESIDQYLSLVPGIFDRFSEWLPARLVDRFGISESEAAHAVRLYAAHLLALAHGSSAQSLPPLGSLGRIAWEEHVLWVQRYEADCRLVLGRVIDHKPNQAALIQ